MVSINPNATAAKEQIAGDIPQIPSSNVEGEGGPRKVAADKHNAANLPASTVVPSEDEPVTAKSVASEASATSILSIIDTHLGKLKNPGMQTRSSNGITKKRALENAALMSSDDELPKRISPPKKTKSSVADTKGKAKTASAPVDDDPLSSDVEVVAVIDNSADARYKKGIEAAILVSDNDSESGTRGTPSDQLSASSKHNIPDAVSKGAIAAERTIIIKKEPGVNNAPADDIELSVSPLKLGSTTAPMDIDCDDENPFLASPVVIQNNKQAAKHADAITSKTDSSAEFADSSTKGKRKPTRILLSDGELVEEEEAAMLLKALRESRRLAEEKKREIFQSSSAIRLHTSTNTPITPTAGETSSPVTSGNTVNVQLAITGLPTPTTPVRPARRTFMDVAPPLKTTNMLGNATTLLDNMMKFQVAKLPARCEVTKTKDLQDHLLADSHGIIRSWNTGISEAASVHCVVFSEWASQCPSLDYDNAERAVLFERHNNFINPSRISPRDVNILYTSEDHKRAVLQCNHLTAICLSPILSRDSCILEPSPQGLRNKYLTGNFHHQEWERFAGFACMVFDHKVMVAQIRDGSISFGTMGMRADRESISPTKPPRNPGILSAQRGTKMNAGSRKFKSNTRFRSVLDANDTIPVYDSRNYPFDFKGDLDRISETLPLYHGEIPPNSFVVVAYTMAQYEKDRAFNLSTNILYAILFGTEMADTNDIFDVDA